MTPYSTAPVYIAHTAHTHHTHSTHTQHTHTEHTHSTHTQHTHTAHTRYDTSGKASENVEGLFEDADWPHLKTSPRFVGLFSRGLISGKALIL